MDQSGIFHGSRQKDQEVVLEKMVSIYTSRDPGVEDPLEEARATLECHVFL